MNDISCSSNLHLEFIIIKVSQCKCVCAYSFADEFSVLIQLRTSQDVDRSLLTLLNFYNHILLQIRIGPHSITFITTQQRDYEYSHPISQSYKRYAFSIMK